MRLLGIGGNMTDLRLQNRSALMRCLLGHAPTSRRSLSRLTGLNPATVTHIVRDLVEEKLVHEIGPLESSAPPRPGPKEVMLDLNPNGVYAVGITIGIRTLAVALVNLRGEVQADSWLPDRGEMSGSENLSWVIEQTAGLMKRMGVSTRQLVGAGVSITGLADPLAGTRVSEIDQAWRDGAIDRPLAEALGVPVLIDNNVRAMAAAETWFGAGRGVSDLLLFWVATTVGCGIVSDHRVHQGHHLAAGQIGHTHWDPRGPLCRCGKRGCLEARVSMLAVARRAAESAAPDSLLLEMVQGERERITLSTVVEAARAGDESALRVIREVAVDLGLVVAETVALVNPQRVVMAGPMVVALDAVVLDPLREVVRECLGQSPAANVEILVSSHGRNIGLVGAATLALRSQLYAPPEPSRARPTRRGEAVAGWQGRPASDS